MNGRLPFLMLSAAATSFAAMQPATADEREFRDLSGFDTIELGGNIELTIRPADEFLVEVVADEGDLDGLVTELNGRTLTIRTSRGSSLLNWWGGSYEVNVALPVLVGLTVSGDAEVMGEGSFAGESLAIRASGGSDVDLTVAVKRLEVQTSGGSDVRLGGSTDLIRIASSGGSDFDAVSLEAAEADIQTSGGSDVSITVRDRIAVNASGGSDVDYRGSPPAVSVNASSGADVRSR